MIHKNNITGIILAGGNSTRMGTDKGLLNYNNKSFINIIADAIQPLVNNVMLISSRQVHDTSGIKRYDDIFPDAGPLAAIYTGLYHSETVFNLVVSCDVPLISPTVLKKLIGHADGSDVVQFKIASDTMPLVALYKKSCMPIIYELLQNNEKRVWMALNRLNVKTVELEKKYWKLLSNVNTKKEFIKIQSMIKVRYFGMLAEVTQCSEELIAFSGTTVHELSSILLIKYPKLNEMHYQFAQNNDIIDESSPVITGEIALLPPFAGG